jgi:hypothetical protein
VFRRTAGNVIQSEPVGNIGAVGELNDGRHDMLVVYVHNLTSIAPSDLLARHRATSAALTIATRVWALRNPFDELDIVGGSIRSYREKPVRNVRILSERASLRPRRPYWHVRAGGSVRPSCARRRYPQVYRSRQTSTRVHGST